MIAIFLIWFVLILLEILRNRHIIELDHERPVYWLRTAIRIVIAFVFWVISPFIYTKMTYWQWWGMVPMMVLTFWWFFDYGLILARNILDKKKLPFYYLNPRGSFLDRLQNKYPAPYPWFWWKFFLMTAGVDLFIQGLDVVWR